MTPAHSASAVPIWPAQSCAQSGRARPRQRADWLEMIKVGDKLLCNVISLTWSCHERGYLHVSLVVEMVRCPYVESVARVYIHANGCHSAQTWDPAGVFSITSLPCGHNSYWLLKSDHIDLHLFCIWDLLLVEICKTANMQSFPEKIWYKSVIWDELEQAEIQFCKIFFPCRSSQIKPKFSSLDRIRQGGRIVTVWMFVCDIWWADAVWIEAFVLWMDRYHEAKQGEKKGESKTLSCAQSQ